jgi:hypothetical protein
MTNFEIRMTNEIRMLECRMVDGSPTTAFGPEMLSLLR